MLSHFGRAAYGNGIVKDGLILWLDAGNPTSYPGSGTTWTDLSGLGNNGTLTNGPTYNSGSGGYISFDGSNDYVGGNISNESQYTVCTFFYVISKKAGAAIVSTPGMFLQMGGGANPLQFLNAVDSTGISTGVWIFGCAVQSSTTQKLFVNGTEKASIAGTSSLSTTYSVGRRNDGVYANVRVATAYFYKRTLSSSEIEQNFNALRGRFGI